jgi:hypothetical protein
VVAKGVVKIGAAHVSHKGTTVTAKLALRLAKRLVGAPLTVDVAATDSTGRTQVEPAAGLIDVTG